MPEYTVLGEEAIVKILDQYEVGSLLSFHILNGGSENTNYLVETNKEQLVLSICEQKSNTQATELASLLNHLEAQGFNSSKVVLSKKKGAIISWDGKPIMLKKFIKGGIVEDFSFDLLKMIGKELATLHQVEVPGFIPHQLNYGIEQFGRVGIYAAGSDFENWLNKISDYIVPHLKLDLPKALIHGDLFWDNIIVHADRSSITIMDFEEAVYYYRVFDIGMTIIGTCAEDEIINITKAQHLLSGYQTEAQLNKEELNALRAFTIYAGASMTFWRHQNFNYVKPDPTMYDHYKGLKVLVDYMIEQDDNCLLD